MLILRVPFSASVVVNVCGSDIMAVVASFAMEGDTVRNIPDRKLILSSLVKSFTKVTLPNYLP